jgi:iron complex outermembrane receptor protein
VPGLNVGVTLFNTAYINAITGTSLSNALNTPSPGLINFFPNGATVAQINALLPPFATASAPLPQTTYYVLSTRQNNVLNLDIQGIDASVNYNFTTDSWGDFGAGVDLSAFTMFKQHLKGGSQFNVLGSTGYNNTFGSVPIQGRAHFGWNFESFASEIFMNYVSGYHNWSGNTVAPVTLVNGLPAGGGDTVKSNTTFDLNLSYTLSERDWLGDYLAGSQFFVDIQNVFDKAPVFYNGPTGYDGYTGNPMAVWSRSAYARSSDRKPVLRTCEAFPAWARGNASSPASTWYWIGRLPCLSPAIPARPETATDDFFPTWHCGRNSPVR